MKLITTLIITLLISINLVSGQERLNPQLVEDLQKLTSECAFMEVSEEMFDVISKDERFKNADNYGYFTKLKYLIYIVCDENTQNFHDSFISKSHLKGFKSLTRVRSKDTVYTFYRKVTGDTKEYLLVHNGGLSYLVTTLDISTVNELSGIMEAAGNLNGR